MAQEEITQTQTEEAGGKAAFQREMIFPIGEPNTAYAKYFIGNSYLAPISREQIPFSNVTFEPGCHNNWHIRCHPHPCECEALAWSGSGQLVRSSRL